MTDFFKNQLEIFVNKELNGNWAELSRRSGVATSTIQSIKGGSQPREQTIYRIARTFELSFDWLLSGEGPMFRNNEQSLVVHPDGNIERLFDVPPDMVPILMLEAAVSAGWGAFGGNDGVRALAWFDEAWLFRQWHVRPKELALFQVVGESMEPTLRSGEWVLVRHHPQGSAVTDGLHVINLRGGMIVKRLQQTLNSLRVTSDNPLFPPFEVNSANETDHFVIIGRVLINLRMV